MLPVLLVLPVLVDPQAQPVLKELPVLPDPLVPMVGMVLLVRLDQQALQAQLDQRVQQVLTGRMEALGQQVQLDRLAPRGRQDQREAMGATGLLVAPGLRDRQVRLAPLDLQVLKAPSVVLLSSMTSAQIRQTQTPVQVN